MPSRRNAIALVGRTALATLAIASVTVPTASAAQSDTPSSTAKAIRELQEKRAAVRSQKANAASKVDALQASTAEIATALAALNSDIEGQSALLEEARRAQAAAEAEQQAAEAQEAKAVAELAALKDTIRTQAITAFVSSPKDQTLALMSAESLADAASRNTLMEVKATKDLDAAEQYRSVQQDLAIARERSTAAADQAAGHKKSVEDRLGSLREAEAKQQEFSDAVERRLEAQLAEAAGLEGIDAQLASQLSSREAELSAQLAAQRAAAQRRSSAGSSGGTTRAPSGVAVPDLPNTNGAEIVSVGGIRVHSSIASSLGAMLAAAAADGVNLAGGGYRDPAAQIAVRRSNCGSSDYAIYQAPSSSCSPPTARPGQSMHERGLAIDFTEGGRTLNRSSSGYQWLRAHAAEYGFYNLPSEAWHWSVNGN